MNDGGGGMRRDEGLLATERAAAVTSGQRDTLKDVRDRALLSFGMVSCMRRSETAALDVSGVARSPEGLRVTIRCLATSVPPMRQSMVASTTTDPTSGQKLRRAGSARHRQQHLLLGNLVHKVLVAGPLPPIPAGADQAAPAKPVVLPSGESITG